MNAIELRDITKSYPTGEKGKTQKVLDVPELEIPHGERFGLVGNNGAGKTTMFRCLLDLIRPDQGKVLSYEKAVDEDEGWKQYTGSFLDDRFLIDFLTPDEYFDFVADLHDVPQDTRDAFLERFEELFAGEIRGKKKYIRDLSTGNKKKTGIAAALLFDPDILILDEPFSGLDPTSQITLKRLLRELNEERERTVLISSHDLDHVTEVCDRIAIMDQGSIVKELRTDESTLDELKRHFAEKTGRVRTEEEEEAS